MEKNNICSLDEFIHSQGLMDWPVSCDEDLEACSLLYQDSGEVCEDLRARVPFPSGAEALKTLLQTLETRLKLQQL